MTNPTSKTLALLINHFNDYVHMPCVGAVSRAQELGLNTRIFCLPPIISGEHTDYRDAENYKIDPEATEKTFELIQKFHLDGLLIHTDVADFIDSYHIHDFIKQHPHIPVATLATRVEGASLIISDNYESEKKAVEHLISVHQCKKIAYVRGPQGNDEADQRYQGYLDALTENNLPIDEEIIFQGNWFFKSGENAVRYFIDEKQFKLDAIVCANDNMAHSAVDHLRKRNIRIPDEIRIIGYDNGIYAENHNFSSISQPHEAMARLAIDELKRRIDHPDQPAKIIKYPGSLILRNSCGCSPFIQRRPENNYLSGDQKKSWQQILEKIEFFKFDSFEHKTRFTKDLQVFWKTLSVYILNPNPTTLSEILNLHHHLLQAHIKLGINTSYWLEIIQDLQYDFKKLPQSNEATYSFFSTLVGETIRSINVYSSALHKNKEEQEYAVMHAGQRLMRSQTLLDSSQIALELLRLIHISSAYIFIFPRDENLKTSSHLQIVGKMIDGVIHDCSRSIIYIERDDLYTVHKSAITAKSEENDHLAVIPLGFNAEIRGYILTEISLSRTNWTLSRSIQTLLTQALQNHNFQEVRAEVLAQKAVNRTKSEFLSRMTHELKTPMNGIIAMTELMETSHLTREQSDYLSIVKNGSQTLLSLIDEILDFSDLETNAITLNTIDFNIAKCIESVIDLYAVEISEKKLSVTYLLESDVPIWIHQDYDRVKQVLTALLSNAVKFTHTGSICILVKQPSKNDKIEISITDSGIGITPKQQTDLFRPFSQGGASIHKQFGGAGLGLTISKKICQRLNGDLTFDPAYKKGARFCFDFTFYPCESKHQLESWEEEVQPIKNENHYHIVSTCNISSTSLCRYLERWGVQYTVQSLYTLDLKCFIDNPNARVVIDIQDESDYELNIINQLIYEIGANRMICFTFLKCSLKEKINNDALTWIFKPIKPEKIYKVLFSENEQLIQANSEVNPDFAKLYPLAILLVEDNIVNQKVMTALLSKCGYEIDIAKNGAEAIEALQRKSYEVVLMDIFMPKMDGETATRIIRSEFPSTKQPYIVAVTANTQKNDRERLIALGMDEYISKPVNISILLNVLKNAKHS